MFRWFKRDRSDDDMSKYRSFHDGEEIRVEMPSLREVELGGGRKRTVTGGLPVVLHFRKELTDFALAMEEKLAKNDHKEEKWRKDDLDVLFLMMKQEVAEFEEARIKGYGTDATCKELVDIANFAMFIFTRLKSKK